MTLSQHNRYIDSFKVFPNGKDGIGIASRLLAMKRPDFFVTMIQKIIKICVLTSVSRYQRYMNAIGLS